ncbi:Gfo/Idh/MocA family oxidoreductase [Candidatus Poribacteria bacterium]|nr:Gfo/Idh/MocA family oxidoreductase [Candidatus Poribacteria bacterium]
MAENIKLALIGCGGIAHAHLNGYKLLKEKGADEFEFTALCDVEKTRVERFAEKIVALGLQPNPPRSYTALEEMLKREALDAADICTPHSYHHLAALPCLESGLDVITEKPFAVSIAAGLKMIKAAKQNGRILATAENLRRGERERATWWALNRKQYIGTPRLFFSESLHFSLNVIANTPWRHDKLWGGGGMTIDGGVHYAELLIYYFGDVERVYAETRNFEPARYMDPKAKTGPVTSTVEDTTVATLTFKSGLTGMWALSSGAPGKGYGRTVYYGSDGSLDGDGVTRKDGTNIPMATLQREFMESLSAQEKETYFPAGITEWFAIELHDFLRAISTRGKPEVDGWDGLKAQAICDAIYESALIGQAVSMESVLNGDVAAYQKEINEHWKIAG